MRHGVVDLKSVHARDYRHAGGKGSGLARLHRFGFDVPDGFVIGTPVFDEMIHSLGIVDQLRQPTPDLNSFHTSSTLETTRDAILAGALPPTQLRRITTAYGRLGGSVAVRSSMVGEDDVRTSLAGQLDTILDVNGESALLDAIKNCYASVCGVRLQRYLAAISQHRPNQDRRVPSLALVVQRMTTGIVSGVSFSADPQTGRRCVIIEAAVGPANTVASGTVEPARWVVDARGVLVERRNVPDDGVMLPDAEVLRLAGLTRRIEACLGCPQDVEWVWNGERFCFLQARPITSLAGKDVYSNALVSDMSPGLIKPLLWSTNTMSMAKNVFGRVFTELIGVNDIDFGRLSRRIHSRIYTNMTMLGDLLQRIGLPANAFEMLARDETGERPPMKMSVARVLLHRRALRFLARRGRARDQIARFVEAQHKALDHYRTADFSRAGIPELMASADDLIAIHGRSQWNVFLAAVNMMIRKRLLDRFLRKHTDGVTAADLLRGLTQLKSLEPNRRFDEMARVARELDGDVQSLLLTGTDEAIRESFGASGGGRKLIRKADRFLADYGFLSASGTDFSTESWADHPELVWQTIGRLAGRPTETANAKVETNSRQLRQRIGRSLNPLHRVWFRRLFESTVSYMDLRERTSLLLSEDAYYMRGVFLALGTRLADEGVLSTPDDIFYLYIEELRAMTSGGRDSEDIQLLIAERRAEMQADALIEPLDTICGDAIPPRAALYPHGDDWYPGIGGSPGVIEGRAVIVRDPSQAPRDLTRRDILVVPYTDIGWTPLFFGIGGIVAETGGQLSHTCIVAREYNLPAVVSVRGATRLFTNGQPITIDGHRGRVHVGHILGEKRSAK